MITKTYSYIKIKCLSFLPQSNKRYCLHIVSLSFLFWHLLRSRRCHNLLHYCLLISLWTFSLLLLWLVEPFCLEILMLFRKNRAWNHWKIVNLFDGTFIHHSVHFMIFLCLMFEIILLCVLFEVEIIIVFNRLTFVKSVFRNLWVIQRVFLWFFNGLLALGSENVERGLLCCLIVIKGDDFVGLSCGLSFWLFGAGYWAVADIVDLWLGLCWLINLGFVLMSVNFTLLKLLNMLLILSCFLLNLCLLILALVL